MTLKPTAEQAAIIDAYRTGDNLVIQAGAGTGKTSTLRLIAEADTTRRGVYIAFNRAIANEAKSSFPSNVKAGTAHSLAFQAVGKNYSKRLNAGRQFPRETARFLRLNPVTIKVHDGSHKMLSAENLSRIVMDAVRSFCRSADTEITTRHFVPVAGLDPVRTDGKAQRGPVFEALARDLLVFAQDAWTDLQQREGDLRFEHDHYLKMFQLSSPRISGDFILFDEAQDANPVIAAIVEAQTHMQIILVGDSSQAIYGFTGAVDAMAKFAATGTTVRTLSQSFRFGPAIAATANQFLDRLDAPLRLVGFDQITSVLAPLDAPGSADADAVLCRTNAGCIAELVQALGAGRKAALVGGTRDAIKFVEAARDLSAGRGTSHSDLFGFTSWTQVEEYVQDEDDAADLKTMVRLIDAYTIEGLLGYLRAATDENVADVVVSTAHKSKGREWDRVRIADFSIDSEADVDPATLMLAYVAVTRAKKVLDLGTLAEFLSADVTPAVVEETPAVTPVPAPVVAAPADKVTVEYAVRRTGSDGTTAIFAKGGDRLDAEEALATCSKSKGSTYEVVRRTIVVSPWA